MTKATQRRPRTMTTRRAVFVLGALEAFPPISMDLYMPALPRLADDLDTSVSLAQATMSACMLGLALGQLVAGPLSDRFGRRRPLLAGTALFSVFSLLCALAPSIQMLLVARFLQGATGSAGIVIGLAVARDLTEGRELARLLSLLGLVGALAPILAPVAGGQLAAVMDWRGIFGVLACVGAGLFVTAAAFLTETLPRRARHSGGLAPVLGGFGGVLRDRLFLTYVVVAACGGAAFFTYLSSVSFVLEGRFGLTPQQFSAVFAANSVMSVLGSQANRVAVRRLSPETMYVAGTTTAAAASLLVFCVVACHWGILPLLGALGLLMLCNGVTMPNGKTLALSEHGARAGTAAAVFGMSAFAVGPVLAPLVTLAGGTALVMGATLAVSSGLAALLVWSAARPLLRKRVKAG